MPQLIREKQELILAVFIILATIFNILETAFPRPVPWLRLGLGNIFILAGIFLFGIRYGIIIGLAKVLLSSIFLGTLFSPAFFMSLAGTLTALSFMSIAYIGLKKLVSVVGISIIGGVFHNLGQFLVIFMIMKFHKIIIIQLPIIIIYGAVTGLVIGLITLEFIKKWEAYREESGIPPAQN